jgi:signal peptidase I
VYHILKLQCEKLENTKFHCVNRFFAVSLSQMATENQIVTDLRTPKESRDIPPVEKKENEPEGATKIATTFEIIWETVRYALVAALIIIPIRTYVAQPFVVSGNSMFPTFHNGEYLIVNELAKYKGIYNRGDVVILRYPNDPSKYFIKRVIGLPGETVTIVRGVVTISGPMHPTPIVLDEPYVKNPKLDSSSRTLSDEEFFVMGDNRAQSSDSRVWGPVPERLMDGTTLLRLFPFTEITLHPGSLESFNISAL